VSGPAIVKLGHSLPTKGQFEAMKRAFDYRQTARISSIAEGD
jgi:hypothetical protein